MLKKGKKKAKVSGEDSDLEMLPRMEIIYEDTKAITRVEPEFKWGQFYQMIKDQTVPDASLEYMPFYVNIRIFAITKVSTYPELLPCVEVIGWILSEVDAAAMIVSKVEKQIFASFNPTYIFKSYKLSAPQIHMIDNLDFDVVDCAKRMMISRKQFCQKA